MKTEHFKGVDDAGNVYQVIAYRTVIHGGDNPIYSLPDYRLADGRSLTPIEGLKKFRIVQTGTEITLV